jgi:hypothetical protein
MSRYGLLDKINQTLIRRAHDQAEAKVSGAAS